ncbi:MAG TPA: CrcB family protein [Mycobacteriales bacterium]|nr:CrcB family protein [Mycobacteriales bacterium]
MPRRVHIRSSVADVETSAQPHRPRHRHRFPPDVIAAIAAGGALGGVSRYGIARLLPTPDGRFPWATFIVNVAGSCVLAGLLVLIFERWPPTRYLRPFAAVGFIGAFTTFSTWIIQTDQLARDGHVGLAVGYLLGSLLAGLSGSSLGLVVGRAMAGLRPPSRSTAD